MTYTPEQARAMVRAAAIAAREMPEAAIDTVVASVMREAGRTQAGEAAGPHLPPWIRPNTIRSAAEFLMNGASANLEQAMRRHDDDPVIARLCEQFAAIYAALASWLEQEAARREQAGCAAKVEILHACRPDEAWASQEEDGSRG